MKIYPIISSQEFRKEISSKLITKFGHTNFCIYSVWYDKKQDYADKKQGYICLASIQKDPVLLKENIYNIIEDYLYYNNRVIEIDYLNFARSKNEIEINKFDGNLPYAFFTDSVPINVQYGDLRYSIIKYVAAGFSALINPNLISSWGYQISH
jgi:hypothetical protein